MSIKWQKPCCLSDVFRTSNRVKMALTIVLLFLFTHAGAQQSQFEGPENTLSTVGSDVTLKCVSPFGNCSGIDWLKYIPGGNPMTIFRGPAGGILSVDRDRYSVDNSSGCDLVIRNVQLTDAGRFICSALISTNQTSKTADLIIILKDQPKCMTNMSQDKTAEGDGVQLTCEVTYNGTNRTSMVWKDMENAPVAMVKNKIISRSDSVVASASDGLSFTCITSFAADDGSGAPILGLATNTIPNITCATPAIKVLYSVRNVQLLPSSSYYSSGSIITCTAEGHPSPTFKWQEMDKNGNWMDIQNQNGSQFTMTNVSSKQYRCFAMNIVRGKSYNATSQGFQVNDTSSGGSTTKVTPLPLTLIASIAAGVGVGLLLLIILLVICFCSRTCPGYKCCHSGKKSMEKIREEQPLTENPDIYSNINEVQHNAPTAKPRSAPSSEPPKLPQNTPPQAKPRTDNRKAEPTNNYQHEEVTYAELAKEDGKRQFVPKYNQAPETLYADVGTA